MAKGRPLTPDQWVNRLLSPCAPILRKSRATLPAYVRIEELGEALRRRGHMLIVTKTHIVVLKSAHMVLAS